MFFRDSGVFARVQGFVMVWRGWCWRMDDLLVDVVNAGVVGMLEM